MIGLSTTYYALKGLDIYSSVESIVELGFEAVELGAAHIYEDDIWQKLKLIRKKFPGITFTVHGLFPPLKERIWFNPADGLNAANRPVIDNLFKAADKLGSTLIGIHPPVLNDVVFGKNKVPGGFWQMTSRQDKELATSKIKLYDVLGYIEKKAKVAGVKVGIETLDSTYFNLLLNSADDFMGIFNQFPSFGLLLDVVHASISGRLAEFARLKDQVVEIHLHESRQIPGEGQWGHYAIRDTALLEPISDLLLNGSIPVILEHGLETTEEEILKEKYLLEGYVGNKAVLNNA
jgi:sugar phosphate isomerase/epimerase